jgi:peptidoglycan/xylan/chitin deacetylase (PgdA/CDA1 family)
VNDELAPVGRLRRTFLGLLLSGFLAVVVSLAGLAAATVMSHHPAAARAAPPRRMMHVQVIHRAPAVWERTKHVPVLVYHEMNNGCPPTAPRCLSHDPDTVSTAQFRTEMNYLVSAGYHTVSLMQYEKWLANPTLRLPAKPILLTVDNGIGNFLDGAQPILAHDGFTATAFLVTGFADGAAGHCEPLRSPTGKALIGKHYNVQPGCGAQNRGWDLTWPALRALSSQVYSFALEAGQSGHFVQDYARHCRMYFTCLLPGETRVQYHARVSQDIDGGITEARRELGSRFIPAAWVVPYSDLGYPPCAQSDCTPQVSTAPRGWLPSWAAGKFRAVFVEDAFRNGVRHERFRMDVNGDFGLRRFRSLLHGFTKAGAFNRQGVR